MTTLNLFGKKVRPMALFCLVMMFIVGGHTITAAAATTQQAEFQKILKESLDALWNGKSFSPALVQRQKTMKTMLTNGEVNKAELASMMEAMFSDLLDRQKTTRYIVKNFPDRVNELFYPAMDWEAVKEALWRAMSSSINDTILIRVGTMAPPGTPWLSVPEDMAFPEIERLSNGKIMTKIYGGGVMGEDTDVLKKMDDRQLECCGCTALGVLAACPEASTLLLPGLFKNYDEVDYIFERFRQRLDKGFEDQGDTLLALIDTGFFYMFSRNKITGLDDIRKQKVITWFGAIERTLYDELGITPVPVAVPDTVSTLATGQADINVAPAAWMLGMQAYQYSNYYIKPPLFYSPAAVIVSGHIKDKIIESTGKSPAFAYNLLEIMVYEWSTIEAEWKRQIRLYEEKSLKAFETKCGMKALTFSPEDQQALEKASRAVQQKLAGKVFPKDLIEDMQKALENYRAKH